jgi:universal stress protein E
VDRITDILVVVNPLVRDQPAIAKAATLARWLGASIELLICNTEISRDAHTEGPLPRISNALLNDNLDMLLEEIAEPLRDDGLDVTTHIIGGDPLHSTVISWMRNSPADLVVKDTHHHSFARRGFTTNTDWHLIRSCSVPLLLTKPKAWAQPPVIMAAVDPGHPQDPAAALDQSILDVATSMANRFDTQAHAMHAYVPSAIALTAVGGLPVVRVSAVGREAEQTLRRSQIKRCTDAYGIPEANLHVDPGTATDCLPRISGELHADIVVMGAVSRSDLKRVLIGGTAERVLETLPCDVLVVKAPDFARNLPF